MEHENNPQRNHTGRRSYLKTIGAGITGLTISPAVVGATSNDLVEIVHTRDVNDDPVKVRKITKERYRRIQVYKEITPRSIGKQGLVNGFRLTGDGDDLQIIALIPKSASKPSSNSESHKGVPVKYEKTDIDKTLKCREGEHFSSMEGGIEIGVKDEQFFKDESIGTSGFVAWNANPDNPFKCLVTATHVVDSRADNDLYQPAPTDPDSRVVGSYYESSPKETMDVVKYRLSESSNPLEVAGSSQDITGYWTYEGMADETSQGHTIPCKLTGAVSCSEYLEADHTSKSMFLDYQVNYDRVAAMGGDSGGPIVDLDGKLLSTMSGQMSYDKDGDGQTETFDFGPAANQILRYINVAMSDPSNIQ